MFTYNQFSGRLTGTVRDAIFDYFGYSGCGDGKNNPAMQDAADVGPLPCGLYTIELIADANGNPIDYEHKKAPVFRLVPDSTNEMFGRSGFLIHGDSIAEPGTASHGCMIENKAVRELILDAVRDGNNRLEVRP